MKELEKDLMDFYQKKKELMELEKEIEEKHGFQICGGIIKEVQIYSELDIKRIAKELGLEVEIVPRISDDLFEYSIHFNDCHFYAVETKEEVEKNESN